MQDHDEEEKITPAFDGFSHPQEKILLEHCGYRLEIWPELGGSIARFDRVTAEEVISLFRPTIIRERYKPTDLACWPLVPYSNRIMNGWFTYEGKKYVLPLNVMHHPHALHGIGWQRPWKVTARSENICQLTLEHTANADWPFSFVAEQIFALSDHGLTLTSSLINQDKSAMPYGFGQHPYIVRPRGTKLLAQVKGVWLTDDTIMPTEYVDLPSLWDLRQGCSLDDIFMDNCFDGLKGPVQVLWPDGSRLIVSASENLDFLVVYNPPEENYVCVEPVSHMTDAINRAAQGAEHTGARFLPAGDKAQATHYFEYKAAS